MPKMSRSDKARLEGWYLSLYCSAIANYKPSVEVDDAVENGGDPEDREEQYVDDTLNFAENIAENGLAHMIDKFGILGNTELVVKPPKSKVKKSNRKRRGSDEDE
jgi:hypothetical protein